MLAAILILCGVLALLWCSKNDSATPQEAAPSPEKEVRIGIAWRADTLSEFYTNVVRAVKEVGGTPVLLAQVVPNGYQLADDALAPSYTDEQGVLLQQYADEVKTLAANGSNVAEAVADVQAVIFTGGEDISPTLLRQPEPWHGIEAEKDYNATRDVSDYLTLSYCLERDLPVLGLCRGMQMLSVVSGATIIQDIPTYFASQGISYDYLHRNQTEPGQYRDFAPHDVEVTTHESLLYQITATDLITGAPSWHHQCVGSVSGTPLRVSGQTTTQGLPIIEVVERTDKTFCLGLQFHPEAAIMKHLNAASSAPEDSAATSTNASLFMTYDEAMLYFQALLNQAQTRRGQ